MSTGWSLVVTAPHRERTVQRMLRALDIQHHLFQELRQQVWRGRIVTKPFPLFPGYIFCALGVWERVRSICGVLGFVMAGERVATVKEATVEELVRASVDDVLPLRVVPIVSRFHSGDRVRVQGANVLAGQVAIFQRMLVGTQALVEIDWMGRWVPIPVDERDLEIDAARRRRRKRRRRGSAHSSRMATGSAALAA